VKGDESRNPRKATWSKGSARVEKLQNSVLRQNIEPIEKGGRRRKVAKNASDKKARVFEGSP